MHFCIILASLARLGEGLDAGNTEKHLAFYSLLGQNRPRIPDSCQDTHKHAWRFIGWMQETRKNMLLLVAWMQETRKNTWLFIVW